MRRVGIGEAVGSENVQTYEDVDVSDCAELTGLDEIEDLLRSGIIQIIVVFDDVEPSLARVAEQGFQFIECASRRLFEDDVSAGIERVHRERKVRRWRRRNVDGVGANLL